MGKSHPRRVVLTGVSRGLGRALAAALIAKGHVVCGCARSVEAMQQLRSRWPGPHRFDPVDVADDEQVGAWARSVLAGGPPDLLINNAALINRNAPLWQISAAEFSQVVDVNLKGVANVIRHFLPAMLERRSGVIVNLSSGWGRSTSPDVAPYCATKFAIEGLTRALAQELPAGMAAIPLNPGIINTDMLQSCFAESAGDYPSAEDWAERALPRILAFGPADNGQPLSIA